MGSPPQPPFYSPVCTGPPWEPGQLVFSQRAPRSRLAWPGLAWPPSTALGGGLLQLGDVSETGLSSAGLVLT